MRFFNKPDHITFFIWFLFDLVYLLWYGMNSLIKGKAPYIADILMAWENLEVHGGLVVTLGVILAVLLEVSLVFSCFLLFKRHELAKYVCYAQIPFRLFFIIPSVSIVLIVVSYTDGYSISVVLGLVAVSEVLKGYTLWRYV